MPKHQVSESPERPDDSFSLPLRPDSLETFRLARLLLLLEAVGRSRKRTQVAIDRLGYYDFLADNPFLVFPEGSAERLPLVLAGFTPQNLSYHSAAHRFANRRLRLQHDLSRLIAFGALRVRQVERRMTYELTNQGRDLAGRLGSMYAIAYRESAGMIVERLNRRSDAALERDVRGWLRAEPFLLDLYTDDAVNE